MASTEKREDGKYTYRHDIDWKPDSGATAEYEIGIEEKDGSIFWRTFRYIPGGLAATSLAVVLGIVFTDGELNA